MTVLELVEALGLQVFAMPDPAREVCGAYAGDLLSWVMRRAQADGAWLTIMSNRNIVAVATLTDVAAIILTEGVPPDDTVAELAGARGVNLLGSGRDTLETGAALLKLLGA